MNTITIPLDALTRFRAAASEFVRPAKQRASRLEVVRDDIVALRAKGASFRTISELLRRCGIHASDTCVLRYCRAVLGEAPARRVKAHHRAASSAPRRRTRTAVSNSNSQASQSTPSTPNEAAQAALLDDLLSYQPPPDDKSAAQTGPRIAKIKFAKPDEL